jgi:hypothetical protein
LLSGLAAALPIATMLSRRRSGSGNPHDTLTRTRVVHEQCHAHALRAPSFGVARPGAERATALQAKRRAPQT